ncbi:MAG: hypothetical protein RLZZ303_2311 [Candidatus Hydrogenedentota bacterium]|jgi:signal transduction histidine kinase
MLKSYSTQKLLIVIGEHEFDQYDLRELLTADRDCEVVFCLSEGEVTVATSHRRADAFLICAGWQPERLAALLRQFEPGDGERFPVYLFGRATDTALENDGRFEIHRLTGTLPDRELLEDLCRRRSGPPAEVDQASNSYPLPPAPATDLHSLTRFLGGIAHDFNNLLAAIMGEVQLAHSRAPDDLVRGHLTRANDACARMAVEIRKLLVFQESAAERRGMVDCASLVRDARGFIPDLLGTEIELETIESAEPLWVEGTVSGLRQIVHNLAAYACAQVTSIRSMRISARRASSGEVASSGGGNATHRGDCAVIEILVRSGSEGNGNAARAFEPVFSRPGRDAGVGLAIAWRLVEDFGGSVSLMPERSGAAAFRVMLPLAFPTPDAGDARLDRLRGAETLLVMSGDRAGVESLLRGVRELGYETVLVPSIDALDDILARQLAVPACILLDTVCGGYDPAEAHALLRARAPRTPMLLASPDMSQLARPPFANDGLACMVHKPLDIKEVLSTMRALLATSAFETADFAIPRS